MVRKFLTIFFLFIPYLVINGQITEKERFFQVSGIITDEEKHPLSNVGVISLKLKRGVLSEKTGIYSITSTPGDTILFKALGFKRKLVVTPLDIEERLLNVDIVLSLDTLPIENVVIMPWKTYSDFIKDMTTPSPVPPEIENMNRNIESLEAAMANQADITISPEAGYIYAMQQNFNAMATRGQIPYNNLLNPFAWGKFINGVKNGLFKNQHFDKPAKFKKAKARLKTKKRKNS